MRDRLYSTADLAKICGVSISTIKRWTDSGILRCVRTPGGHRKFRLQDVADATRQLGTNITLEDEPRQPAAALDELALLLLQENHDALVARLSDFLEAGESELCRETLVHLRRHGMSLLDLCENVVRRSYEELRVSHAQQSDSFVLRRGRTILESAMHYLMAHIPAATSSAPLAILAASRALKDSLWLPMAHLIMLDRAWRVVDLGPDVPVTTLRSGAARENPKLVVLFHEELGSGEIALLANDLEARGTKLLELPGQAEPAAVLEGLVGALEHRKSSIDPIL